MPILTNTKLFEMAAQRRISPALAANLLMARRERMKARTQRHGSRPLAALVTFTCVFFLSLFGVRHERQ